MNNNFEVQNYVFEKTEESTIFRKYFQEDQDPCKWTEVVPLMDRKKHSSNAEIKKYQS